MAPLPAVHPFLVFAQVAEFGPHGGGFGAALRQPHEHCIEWPDDLERAPGFQAKRVNQVWSCDLIFEQTEDGRRLKRLPICDEFSRELVALEVGRQMEAKDMIRILDEAVLARGCVPEFIHSDNGLKFVALAVQDWIARLEK